MTRLKILEAPGSISNISHPNLYKGKNIKIKNKTNVMKTPLSNIRMKSNEK